MKIKSFDTRIPIYQQVINHVEELIVSGELEPGQELPSRRELARLFSINPNTVQRAFSEMEEKKWLFTEMGRPSQLTKDPQTLKKIRLNWVNRAVKNFVNALEAMDLTTEEIIQLIKTEIESRKDEKND